MRVFLAILGCLGLGASALGEVPDIESFRVVPQFPAPAMGAGLTLGTADTSRGRILLWNGDAVSYQELNGSTPGPLFDEVATGYVGDPSFVALSTNNRTAYLGSGVDGLFYQIPDILNPPADPMDRSFTSVSFFSGTLLNEQQLLVDRMRDDMTGAELWVVHITRAQAELPTAQFPVLQKPAGSLPAAIFVDRDTGRTWIMDGATGELRSFSSADLREAYFSATPLDWETDGILVGTPGQFLQGGVYGRNRDNELLIGGDIGAGTGGIQYVSLNNPLTVVDTLDPAGTGPPYELIYSRARDEVLAIDPTATPPAAYASVRFVPAIPPDSPCEDFDEIDLEYAAFLEAFAPAMTDLDADTIRDSAMLALIEMYSCRSIAVDALAMSTNEAYDNNRATLAAEGNAAALEPYSRIVPILLFMNEAMRAATLNVLSMGGAPLTGMYQTVACEDIGNCTPEFVEDAVVARQLARGVNEPYSAMGNPDDDDFTNLEEYENNEAKGGTDTDFAVAASSPFLDGTAGRSGGGGGGCFIATAAYGTPMSSELDALRGIRDGALLTNAAGGVFVDAYYRMSPAMAAWIADRPAARAAVRYVLLPFVSPGVLAGVGALVAAIAMTGAVRASRKPVAVQRK